MVKVDPERSPVLLIYPTLHAFETDNQLNRAIADYARWPFPVLETAILCLWGYFCSLFFFPLLFTLCLGLQKILLCLLATKTL